MNLRQSFNKVLFTSLPHHAISRVMGRFANCRIKWFKNWGIQRFIRKYDVDLSEAKQVDPLQYTCFNDFFTRELATGVRPVDHTSSRIVSPVDGTLSVYGAIERHQLIQAKGRQYSVESLLADAEYAQRFVEGQFATLYLSPKDYHRIHMPLAGTLTRMTLVPGRLFSVNQQSVDLIPTLFARNERLIAYFDTEFGPMAMVLVGAMIVASIKTVWSEGLITPVQGTRAIRHWDYSGDDIRLLKGDEMGHFQLGSTVILLMANKNIGWRPDLTGNSPVKMGQFLAEIQQSETR